MNLPNCGAALALAFALLPLHAAAAGKAHEHGIARLDIAVDARTITLHLDSPLDNLLGFEHEPRTEAQRRQADALVSQLQAADQLFRFDPAAQCALTRTTLESTPLKLGAGTAPDDGHADLDGDFEFTCADPARAAYVDVALFRFDHLQQISVQVAAPDGQFRRDLKRPATRVALRK